MTDELKPCPFCGEPAAGGEWPYIPQSDSKQHGMVAVAQCPNRDCPVQPDITLFTEGLTPEDTGTWADVKTQWNTRPIEDELRADATLWRDHVGQRQAMHYTWAIMEDEAKTFFGDVADLRAKWDAIPWGALRSIVSQMYQPESHMTYEGLEQVENWIIFNSPKDATK